MEWQDDPWSEVFDDDYLYFYEARLAAEPSDRETEQILAMLDLPPEATVLDAPCGHGRIANRLAARGLRVVGLDTNQGFLELARRDAADSEVDARSVLRLCRTAATFGAWLRREATRPNLRVIDSARSTSQACGRDRASLGLPLRCFFGSKAGGWSTRTGAVVVRSGTEDTSRLR